MKALSLCVALGAAGCSHASEEPRLLDAMVAFPHDTVRFALPARVERCGDGRSVLLEAAGPEGFGVLVRLRYRDSLASDSYPVIAPGDSVTAPGATVAVRYFVRDVGHGFAFDSGAVVVQRHGATIGARIRGSGVENGIHTPARIEYRDVPLSPAHDTVSCRYRP